MILIDARKGVLTQTRRHSYLVSSARHPQHRARGQQDGPGRLRSGAVRGHRRATIARSRRRSASPISWPIPISGLAGDNIAKRSDAHALVHGPDADRASGDRGDRRRGRPGPAVPHAGAVGQSAESRFSRLRRASSRPAPSGPAIRCACCPPARPRASAASSPWTAILPRAVAGQSVTLCLQDEIDCSRGDVIAAADAPAAGGRSVRGDDRLDGGEPLLPGRPYWLKLGDPNRHRDAASAQVPDRTSTPWSIWPRRRSSSTRSASCNLATDRPSSSIRTPRTATSAVSS